jgi:anti-anti-sigma factor
MAAVKSEAFGGIALVTIEGTLADEACTDLRTGINRMIDGKKLRDLVIDLSGCETLSSDGLESLLAARARCEEIYGRLKLAGLDDNLRDILRLTRLDHRFECCNDAETAMRLMRS